MRQSSWIKIVLLPLTLAGCTHRVDVEPIRIEPIYMTLDIRVRVDRELEEAFDFEDEIEAQFSDELGAAPDDVAPEVPAEPVPQSEPESTTQPQPTPPPAEPSPELSVDDGDVQQGGDS